MTSHHKKVVAKPVDAKIYSPVALVKAHGDSWRYFLPDAISPKTSIALSKMTSDHYDYVMMGLMEKGIMGRINEF
jgi:hypothetical protein